MSASVIILSRTPANALSCCLAVRHNEPDMRIVVVWDSSNNAPPCPIFTGCDVIEVSHDFCFARNVNRGIAESGDDDVIVLNDDALLQTYGGFSQLVNQSVVFQEYGVISSSISGFVGNRNQIHSGIGGLRDEPRMVCFIAVLIPRRVIDAVGLLDEEFVGYGADDDSYCLRARRAGFKIGVYDGCVVEHGTLPSTFRTRPNCRELFNQNMEIFKRKYGVGNLQL